MGPWLGNYVWLSTKGDQEREDSNLKSEAWEGASLSKGWWQEHLRPGDSKHKNSDIEEILVFLKIEYGLSSYISLNKGRMVRKDDILEQGKEKK